MNIDYIKILEGESFGEIGRAADMCWISFGRTITVKDHNGAEQEKGTYALHLQSPWRIVKESTQSIIMASGDIYEPNSNLDWTKEFEWDKIGANLFDEKAQKFNAEQDATYVLSIIINEFGDIKINFSNGYLLDSFMNTSSNEEGWRFFKCNCEGEHMIGTGSGVRFE